MPQKRRKAVAEKAETKQRCVLTLGSYGSCGSTYPAVRGIKREDKKQVIAELSSRLVLSLVHT